MKTCVACSSLVLLLLAGAAAAQPKPAEALTIKLATGTPEEARTKEQLERLLGTYDVEPWLFTRSIVVDGRPGVIPHSHPVLTLNNRHLKDDDLLLATFVHEQIHWFIASRHEDSTRAKAELRGPFPKVPPDFPMGAGGEDSGYLHLLVNYLEYQAVKELLGELRAWQVMEFWATDHYTWLYRQVLDSGHEIGAVIRKHKLWIP